MIESHIEEIVVEKKIIDEIICNMCGNIIENGNRNYDDYLHIEKNFGYFSKHEGEVHNLDICGNCYDKIVKQCKIAPMIDFI